MHTHIHSRDTRDLKPYMLGPQGSHVTLSFRLDEICPVVRKDKKITSFMDENMSPVLDEEMSPVIDEEKKITQVLDGNKKMILATNGNKEMIFATNDGMRAGLDKMRRARVMDAEMMPVMNGMNPYDQGCADTARPYNKGYVDTSVGAGGSSCKIHDGFKHVWLTRASSTHVGQVYIRM